MLFAKKKCHRFFNKVYDHLVSPILTGEKSPVNSNLWSRRDNKARRREVRVGESRACTVSCPFQAPD